MSHCFRNIVWAGMLVLSTTVPAWPQFTEPIPASPNQAPTCDPSRINPESYALTTHAQAGIVTEDRLNWWDGFSGDGASEALHELNSASSWAAERALALDPNNLLAHGLLARQYVVTGFDGARARDEWRTVLDGGGAVVWTATLYDVDTKSYFMMAFDRHALRVYRFGELAAPVKTRLGFPLVPGAERERLWRAWGGCIDADARPEAVIPWTDERQIKAGNWVLYFKLTRRIHVTSDRGKKADLHEIKVNLHGATGSVEVLTTRDPIDPWKFNVRTMGIGPLAYQERVRRTVVAVIDPAGRIVLPKASRSAGW